MKETINMLENKIWQLEDDVFQLQKVVTHLLSQKISKKLVEGSTHTKTISIISYTNNHWNWQDKEYQKVFVVFNDSSITYDATVDKGTQFKKGDTVMFTVSGDNRIKGLTIVQ